MMNKSRIAIGIGIVILTLATLSLFILSIGTISLSETILIGIILVLIISVSYILWDRLKNVKKGLPAEDERLKLVNYKAGYYGFIAAIWCAVGSNILSDILFTHEPTASQLAGVVVLASGFVFIVTYLYLSRKGN